MAEVGALLLELLLLKLLLLVELDELLPLELELLLTAVVSVGCAVVTLRKWRGRTLFFCFPPLLMLLTFQVLPVSPIRGTNKSPTITKRFT